MESWAGGLWDGKAVGRSPPNTVTENTWREMGTWRRTVTEGGREGGVDKSKVEQGEGAMGWA